MKCKFILYLVLLTSCNNTQNFFKGSFSYTPRPKEIITLNTEEVKLDIYGVFFLHLVDDFIVVENDIGDDYFLSVFDKNNFDLLGRFIHKGRANEEYQMLVTSKSYIIDSTGVKIWINTGPKRELILFNISKSVLEKRTIIDRKISVNNRISKGVSSLSYVNDSLVLGSICNIVDSKIIIYDYLRDTTISTFDLYNDTSFDLSIFSGITVVKPDGTKWVNILESFNQLNFYSMITKKAKSISTHNHPVDLKSIENDKNRKRYYTDIWCNNEIVIAGYRNNDDCRQCNELHFFNWNGELLTIFKVDKEFIGITVDTMKDEIYLDNVEEKIYKVSIENYFDL